MVAVALAFGGASTLISIVDVRVYTLPTGNKNSSFATSSPIFLCRVIAILTEVRWNLNVVLIYMTLMAKDSFFKNLFVYPFVILLLRTPCSYL